MTPLLPSSGGQHEDAPRGREADHGSGVPDVRREAHHRERPGQHERQDQELLGLGQEEHPQ